MQKFDLVVIGSGPGGQRAAIQAAKLGRSVAVVERASEVGGVCINTGTIPARHCARRCRTCRVAASGGSTAKRSPPASGRERPT